MLSRLTSKIFSSFSKKAKMEVTKTNFAEKLPLIEAAIRDAEFISIDGEFTGLHEDGGRNSALDTPAERYEKKRRSVNKFLIVQFGKLINNSEFFDYIIIVVSSSRNVYISL